MTEKFIMIGLNDERSKKISEILGNKTCKKIIDFLSEVKEASEKDISEKLNIPINTAEYNIRKLVGSGLVEKTKNFFWSIKGRKIEMYRLSNARIVISPRTMLRGIAPAVAGILALSIGIKFFSSRVSNVAVNDALKASTPAYESFITAGDSVVQVQNACSNNIEAWAWFLLGGLISILIILLWNQFKKMKGGNE